MWVQRVRSGGHWSHPGCFHLCWNCRFYLVVKFHYRVQLLIWRGALTNLPSTLSVWLLQALGDSEFTDVLRQLLALTKPRRGEGDRSSGARSREDEYGPDQLILLLVYLYSLADEAQPSDRDTAEEELEKLEMEVIGALTLVITQEQHLSPLLQKLTGEKVDTTALLWLLPGVHRVCREEGKWNRRAVKADC